MTTDFISGPAFVPHSAEAREREPALPFAFRLIGILPLVEAWPRREEIRISSRLVNSVATALPPGTRAAFHHHRTSAGEIAWTLAGEDNSADSRLAATLRSALAASGGVFQFENGESLGSGHWPHRARLQPVTRLLRAQSADRVGFGAALSKPTKEILRLPTAGRLRAPAFPSLGALLQSAPCEAAACVGITRVTLSEEEVATLREAARQLFASPAAPDHAAVGWLEDWMRVPQGWRLDCEVVSREPLAEPFLQLIGGEVFGQQVEIIEEDAEERADVVLDLSASRHAENALPRLFPGGTLLASLRQPRSYNRALPHLPASGALIGEVECQGGKHPLYLPTEMRDRHLWTVGATGCGKSTLLLNLIAHDIAEGRGLALIDPHGDLFERVLASIPPERIGDVVLLEPGRGTRVPGLNFLEVADGPLREVQRNFVINELLGIFDQLWDMSRCGGPMFQVYFRNALLLLMGGGAPDATLTELAMVFESRPYRDRLKAACRDPLVTGFWTNQAEKAGGDISLSNIAPYITSKLNVFTHSSVLRPIIGQTRSKLDFRGLLSKRGILLVNLSKGLIGDAEARLLGMLLLGRIFAAGMERAVLPPHRRTPFSIYVDETQNFLTPTLAAMLGEARKFGLRLCLSNQNLAQLSARGRSDLLQAMLGNVGSLVSFRLGPVDAQTLAPYAAPAFNASTLERLPNFHAVGRILTQEGPLDPLVFRTLPPAPITHPGVAGAVRRKQRRFTRSIAEVEMEIRARRDVREPDAKHALEQKVRSFSN